MRAVYDVVLAARIVIAENQPNDMLRCQASGGWCQTIIAIVSRAASERCSRAVLSTRCRTTGIAIHIKKLGGRESLPQRCPAIGDQCSRKIVKNDSIADDRGRRAKNRRTTTQSFRRVPTVLFQQDPSLMTEVAGPITPVVENGTR